MRAIVLAAFGGPEALEMTDWPDPTPADDEVVIRVRTVAVNRMDLEVAYNRGPGQYVRPPLILGIDPAGEVVSVGPRVGDLTPGDRVVVKPNIPCGTCRYCLAGEENVCPRHVNVGVHRPGGFAEYVAVPARNAFRIPDALLDEEASALAHSVPVALMMLRELGHVSSDDVVLVTGAGGGVGTAAVQLSRLFGARVIAAASSDEKLDLARRLGAEAGINYTAEPNFLETLQRLAGSTGVTLLIESVGDPEVWREATPALGRRARIVVCAGPDGGLVPLDLRWLFRNHVAIMGTAGSTYAAFRESLRLAGEGKVRPIVYRVLPFDQVHEAFRILQRRENRGKVVLRVAH